LIRWCGSREGGRTLRGALSHGGADPVRRPPRGGRRGGPRPAAAGYPDGVAGARSGGGRCVRRPARLITRAGAQTLGGSSRLRTFSSRDRKSTRLNSSHVKISYAVFCLKK